MGLFEDLRNLSEQVKKRQASIKGEESTKLALVLPFLQVLGFDIYDPNEVKPEYIADFAKKKSSGQFEKIDYSINLKGETAIFVECKAIDAAVEDHDGQLARYFNSTQSVKLAVLTNGIKYRFFTDLRAANIMDASPFLEFNILHVSERETELLKPFTKELFNSSIIQRHAEEVISFEKVTALVNDLLRNPNEKFIRFILSELDLVGGRVTANVVERFAPIVKKSVQTALLGMVTKSMQQEIAPTPAPATVPDLPRSLIEKPNSVTPAETLPHRAPPSKIAIPAVPTASDKEGAGILTTEEELEVFRVVCRICADSTMKAPVKYKDGTNFFAINLGPVRTWFLRLFAGSRRKSFMARLPLGQAEPLAQGLQVEPVPENPDKCRVYFSTISDVEKLRSLILRAYEDAVRRHESSSAETDDASE